MSNQPNEIKMGRPVFLGVDSVTVGFKIPRDMLEAIEDIAWKNRLQRSVLLRELLAAGLKSYTDPLPAKDKKEKKAA